MSAKSAITKFRTNYDPDFKSVVVKYAIQTSNKAASDRFGINESNVRRWKRLYMREKEELYENPLARRPVTSKKSWQEEKKFWAIEKKEAQKRYVHPGKLKRYSTTSNVSDIYDGTEEVAESDNATSGENQNEESREVTENIKEEEPELESQVQRVETPRLSHSQERLQLQIVERQFSTTEGEDESDLFFSSMAKIVKRLPPRERTKIRMEISTIVGNAELKYLADTESSCPSSSAIENFIESCIFPGFIFKIRRSYL